MVIEYKFAAPGRIREKAGRIPLFVLVTYLGLFLAQNSAAAAEFRPMGFLDGNHDVSRVAGLSSDGSVALGESFYISDPNGFPNQFHGALFRWTTGAGMTPLVEPSTPEFSGTIDPYDQPRVTAISRDGSTILFDRSTYEPNGFNGDLNSYYDRYLWSPTDGFQNVFQSTPPLFNSSASWSGLSQDGKRRVGAVGGSYYVAGHPNLSAVVWGNDGYWMPLGNLPIDASTNPISRGLAMSSDSAVVVGYSTSLNAKGPNNYVEYSPDPPPAYFVNANGAYEAFVWTQSGGMVGLGDLPGGIFDSSATGVSANGQFVIGKSSIVNGREAFLWTSVNGMQGLGYLNSDHPESSPGAASNNGIVVGTSLLSREIAGYYDFTHEPYYNDTYAAFIWDEANGFRNLKTALAQDYGIDLTGWQLTSAVGISDDGLTIAGNGINPLGQQEGWVVRLQAVPEPSAKILLAISLISFCILVRRRT